MKLSNPTLLAILCTLASAAPVAETAESRYSNYAYPHSDYHYSIEAANENHPTLHQRQIYQRNGHLFVGGNPQGYSEDGQPADWPWNPAHKDLKVANQNRPFIVFIDSQGNLNAENDDDTEQFHITIDPSTSALRINVGDSPSHTSDRHWSVDRTFNQMSTARRNFKADSSDAIAYACVVNRSPDQRWQAARNPTYDQKYEGIQATKEFTYKETNKKEIWYKETDQDRSPSPPADTQYTPPQYAAPPNYEYETRPAVDPEYQLYMSPDTRFACPNGERAITIQLQGRDQTGHSVRNAFGLQADRSSSQLDGMIVAVDRDGQTWLQTTSTAERRALSANIAFYGQLVDVNEHKFMYSHPDNQALKLGQAHNVGQGAVAFDVTSNDSGNVLMMNESERAFVCLSNPSAQGFKLFWGNIDQVVCAGGAPTAVRLVAKYE
ncbi:hypothetical protein CJU89_3239 [Yarrowia sp. B02]|nr:hypothetical protein CJU89_3239 [Yarrowia sp. B02]